MPRIDPEVLPYWIALAVVALVGIGVALFVERRGFAIRGKARPWLALRIASIPIVALTAAAVWFSARAVGGPEGLLVFYLLLVTLAPALYFGLHWLAGRGVGLTGREALGVGLVGLAILLGPPLLFQFTQDWVWSMVRNAKEARFAKAPQKPLPHRIVARQRFDLPGVGEIWTEHWQAPPGVATERIELEVRGQYSRVDSGSSGFLCRSGHDAHVLWMAAMPPPRWRVHWMAEGGALARSEWTSVPPQGAVAPFALRWLPDGFVLPARIAREVVTLGHTATGGKESFDSLDRLQAGENFADNCLPLEYRRVNAANEPAITAVGLRLWNPHAQQTLRAVLRRAN